MYTYVCIYCKRNIYIYIYTYIMASRDHTPNFGRPFFTLLKQKVHSATVVSDPETCPQLKQEIQDLLDNVEDAGICPGDKWVASPWSVPGLLTRLFKRRRMGSTAIRPSGHHPLIKIVVLPFWDLCRFCSLSLGDFGSNPVAKEWDPHHLMGLDQHRTRCDSEVMVIGSDEFTNLTLGNLMTVCWCINFESLGHFFILKHHHIISHIQF